MASEPAPPDPAPPAPAAAPRRDLLRPVLIGATTTGALLLAASVFARAYLGSPFEWFDRDEGDGKRYCYFDGGWRPNAECPGPGHAAPAEAEVFAVVVDSLYYGFDRATAPRRAGLYRSERNPLLLAASAPAADALPGAAALPGLLERELADSAAPLLAAYRAANAMPTRHRVQATIEPRQELLDSAAAARFLASRYDTADRRTAAEQVDYFGAPGVLTLSRAGIDSARSLALVFAGLRVPGDSEGRFRATEYVILRKRGTGWILWKEIPLPR
jgi:hypothetical protein